MCARSIGSSERDAIHATSRAEARYCAGVNPPEPYVNPSCSIPTDSELTCQLPACQAMSERWTSWMILPLRATTKCEEACARGFFSQLTEPQKLPSVTWITILRIAWGRRCDFVKFPSPLSQTSGGRGGALVPAAGTTAQAAAIAAATTIGFQSLMCGPR